MTAQSSIKCDIIFLPHLQYSLIIHSQLFIKTSNAPDPAWAALSDSLSPGLKEISLIRQWAS